MTATKQSHEIDIRTYAEGLATPYNPKMSAEDVAEQYGDDGYNFDCLDITCLLNADGAGIVEFLLTCGGPTVYVKVDTRYSRNVTLYHSWGYGTTSWDLFGDDASEWEQYAEELAEMEHDSRGTQS